MIFKVFRHIWLFVRTIATRFAEDRLTYSASALTYTTLLAIVPLMTVTLAIFSAFPVFKHVSAEVQQLIFQNFIPTSGEVISKYLQQFSLQAGQLSVVGTAFLILTAVMMMLTIERALNDVWRIKGHRRVVSAVLGYWAILSLAPIAMVVSLAVTSYVASFPLVMGTAKALGLGTVLLESMPTIITVFGFTLLYYAVPNCYVPFRYAFAGSVVATILFELSKKLFVIYLKHFPTYHLIYGAFAILPVFLVWVYLLWVIILFGALISNILTTYYFATVLGELDGFTHAFLWLGYLWQAQQHGRGLTLKALQKRLPGSYQVPVDVQLKELKRRRLIETLSGQKFILSRDFSKMTLAELYETLPWKLPHMENERLFSKKVAKIFDTAHSSIIKTFDIPLDDIYEDLFK